MLMLPRPHFMPDKQGWNVTKYFYSDTVPEYYFEYQLLECMLLLRLLLSVMSLFSVFLFISLFFAQRSRFDFQFLVLWAAVFWTLILISGAVGVDWCVCDHWNLSVSINPVTSFMYYISLAGRWCHFTTWMLLSSDESAFCFGELISACFYECLDVNNILTAAETLRAQM